MNTKKTIAMIVMLLSFTHVNAWCSDSDEAVNKAVKENAAIIQALRAQQLDPTFQEELQSCRKGCFDCLKKAWVMVYFCCSAINAERRQNHQD